MGKIREIIMNLCMWIPLTAINIPRNRVAMEIWPPDDRGRGQSRWGTPAMP